MKEHNTPTQGLYASLALNYTHYFSQSVVTENLYYHGTVQWHEVSYYKQLFHHQIFEAYLTERSKSRTKIGQVFDMSVFSQLSSSHSRLQLTAHDTVHNVPLAPLPQKQGEGQDR